MASLYQKKNSAWVISFYSNPTTRKQVFIGMVNERVATRIKEKVDAILECLSSGAPFDDSIKKWVSSIADSPLAKNLTSAGLLKAQTSQNLKALIDGYIALRSDVKENTRKHMQSSKKRMLAFFSEDTALSTVTKGNAEEFRIYLLANYAGATAGRTLKAAIQFFDYAVDCGTLFENPFKKVKIPRQTNEENMFFVDGATALRVIEASSSMHKKLVFAFARFGGLRIPSEIVELRWEHIYWEQGKFLVHSPKTEHHEGQGKRMVPLFPELRKILEQAFAEKKAEDIFVCGQVRSGDLNLRTGLLKTLKKIGVKPWPKLFANLRSSRETELVDNFPLHVVTKWIGHTPEVAKMHYLQLLDRHWNSAVTTETLYQSLPTVKENPEL